MRASTPKLRDELLNGEIFTSLREAEGADRELAPALQRRQAYALISYGYRAARARKRSCRQPVACPTLRFRSADGLADRQPDSNLRNWYRFEGRPSARIISAMPSSWAICCSKGAVVVVQLRTLSCPVARELDRQENKKGS